MELRLYQIRAIESLRESLRLGNKRIMLYSPCGSGKTELSMSMIMSAVGKGKRTLFIVNRLELINQTSRRFYGAGIPHGLIQGNNTRMVDSNVLICSIQTLAKRGFPDADFIVIDEAHYTAGSIAYQECIKHYKDKTIIALSASPFSKGLGKQYDYGRMFQDLRIATTIQQLINDKFLVDVEIYSPDKPDLSKVRTVAGDYNEKDLGEACDKPLLIGSIVDHWIKYGKNKPTVCFAVNISHSQHIANEFMLRGISAEHIDCYASEDERKVILERVTSGTTKIICNVGLLSTGWDFPECSTMIMARPTKSLIFWIQASGRIMRPFPGKTIATMLDHSGNGERLGFPTDDLPLELDDGKPKPKNEKEQKEKEAKLPKPCPQCTYLKKTAVCPICGFKPKAPNTIEVGDGNLVLLERGIDKKEKFTHQDKQIWWSSFLFLAEKKGKSRSYALAKYKQKFGVWPRMLEEKSMTPSLEVLNWEKSRAIAFSKRFANAK